MGTKQHQLSLGIPPTRGAGFVLDEPVYDGTFWGTPSSMGDLDICDKNKIKMATPKGWQFVKLRGFLTIENKVAIIEDANGNVMEVHNKNAFRIPRADARRERRLG